MFARALLLFFIPLLAVAQDRLERDGVVFSASARTPEQMRAFYAARGFPESMIREITATCFVTAGVLNRRDDVLFLELAQWRFTDAAGKPVQRVERAVWDRKWAALNAPLASRATFGWTQLPESRDLQPGEPVGGNVALVAPSGPFVLHASFRTASGRQIEMSVPDLTCPREGAAP